MISVPPKRLYLPVRIYGARGGAVGWGTALQAGMSRVRFLMVSSEFFIYSAFNGNEYQEYFLGVNVAGAHGWQPYHIHVPIVLKSGSLNFLEPSRPVQGYNGNALPLPLPLPECTFAQPGKSQCESSPYDNLMSCMVVAVPNFMQKGPSKTKINLEERKVYGLGTWFDLSDQRHYSPFSRPLKTKVLLLRNVANRLPSDETPYSVRTVIKFWFLK